MSLQAGLPTYLQSDLSRQRQAYQQKMEAQLARWRADILTLEAELNEAQTSEKIALQEQLATLKTKMQHAAERLDNLKESTGDAWAEIQTDIDDIWEELSQAVELVQKEIQ